MKAYQIFKKLYTPKSILQFYEEKIYNNCSTGLDKITPLKFDENKNVIISKISEKVLSGKYNFTKYKKMLIAKGEQKYPRVICMPTIRDKLVLSVLHETLNKIFGDSIVSLLPQTIINNIYTESQNNNYDGFIKIDIKTFYASINHNILFQKLHKKIRKVELLALIKSAIKTPALEIPIKNRQKQKNREIGIPEGISISSILANIYLMDLDKKYSNSKNFSYHRYVDDILILCKSTELDAIKNSISNDLKNLKLETNEKDESGLIKKGFEYLGYKFDSTTISARESTILKYETSLEQLFSSYKHAQNPSLKLLEWKLNLKITGCIIDGKKNGWLFYFSQIDDMNLITHFDCLIAKFSKRFKITENNLSFKRFKRTYYEIKYNLHSSNYIPNFDKYTISDIRTILENIYDKNLKELNDEQIVILFKKIMKKETKELEKDVQFFS